MQELEETEEAENQNPGDRKQAAAGGKPNQNSDLTTVGRDEDPEQRAACRKALEKLHLQTCEDNLWECVVAFEGQPFWTASGLPFVYTLKKGRNGLPMKELWINRRAQSKSLSWGSVRLAYRKARELDGAIVTRPKALGDLRGISYVYPILWKFGLIRVPVGVAEKMRGI